MAQYYVTYEATELRSTYVEADSVEEAIELAEAGIEDGSLATSFVEGISEDAFEAEVSGS